VELDPDVPVLVGADLLVFFAFLADTFAVWMP